MKATPIQNMRGNHAFDRTVRIPGVAYVRTADILPTLIALRASGVQVPLNLKQAQAMTPAERATLLKQIGNTLG